MVAHVDTWASVGNFARSLGYIMESIRKVMDFRRSHVKQTHDRGRSQMVRYFQCRYSWGQPCDPRRADDWGTLCAYLRDCQCKGLMADFRKVWEWPSGNKGSIAGMINIYHDGHDLLDELGLVESLDFV